MSLWLPPSPDTDPLTYEWSGVAVHGNTPFDTTLISEIEPGLYLGGCLNGLTVPLFMKYVVSLYPWEAYKLHDEIEGTLVIKLYDEEVDSALLFETARMINAFRWQGSTLVHCQAGLNRSSLVLALALMLEGRTAEEAINYLRHRRSPAVLCNPHFERWLRELTPERMAA